MTLKDHFFYNRSWFFSLLVIGFFCSAYYLLEYRNHGINMVDFEVFYRTADRMVHGGEIYQLAEDGDYVFKYSPTAAVYFTPFLLLPLNVAKVVYWLLVSWLVTLGFYLFGKLFLGDMIQAHPARVNTILLVTFVASFMHIERELVLGQVNWLLLVTFLWMIGSYIRQKRVLSPALLSGSIFIKPFGLIFIPYYILKKDFLLVASFFLFTIGLFIIPLLFYDFQEYLQQLTGWYHELSVEMGRKQALSSPRVHTLFSVLYRYTPMRWSSLGPTGILVFQGVVLLSLGAVVLWFINMGKGLKNAQAEDMGLLIGLIPLLAFTNEYAFLFLTPVMVICLSYFNIMKLPEKIILIAGLTLKGGNVAEIWGSEWTGRFLDWSVVSLGSIMILLILFIIRKRLSSSHRQEASMPG